MVAEGGQSNCAEHSALFEHIGMHTLVRPKEQSDLVDPGSRALAYRNSRVKVLSGDAFRKRVIENGEPWLIKFYAPWYVVSCGASGVSCGGAGASLVLA